MKLFQFHFAKLVLHLAFVSRLISILQLRLNFDCGILVVAFSMLWLIF